MSVNHITAFEGIDAVAGSQYDAPKEVMLGGNPTTTDWPVFDSTDGAVSMGVWESEHYHKIKQHPNEMEYCFILEGEVKISDQQGNSQHFKAGEAFVVKPGFDGVWESLGRVKKHYVICKCN